MNTILLIASALLALAALFIVKARRRRKALRKACQNAFEAAYTKAVDKPSFYMSYGYGVPIFKVTHSSLEAHEHSASAGANEAFRAGVQSVCGESGSKANPYQAARAIQFAWLAVGNEVFYSQAKHSSGAGEA